MLSISLQMQGQNQESPVRVRDTPEPRVAISPLLSQAHGVPGRHLNEESKGEEVHYIYSTGKHDYLGDKNTANFTFHSVFFPLPLSTFAN